MKLLGMSVIGMVFAAGGCYEVGEAEPELMPRYSVYGDCTLATCGVAIGSQVELFAETFGPDDVDDGAGDIHAATLEDASMGDVAIVGSNLSLTARAEGRVRLTTTLDRGTLPAEIDLAPVATARVLSELEAPLRLDPAPSGLPPLVFAGSSFTAYADYRDANDRRLLGSGIEAWSVSGGTLAEVAATGSLDTSRVRRVTAGTPGKLVVHARPSDVPAVVDVVPAHSTETLLLVSGDQQALYTFTIDRRTTLTARPRAADGRTIRGVPEGAGISASVEDPAIATIQSVPGGSAFTIVPVAEGITDVTVTFDGVTVDFELTVE